MRKILFHFREKSVVLASLNMFGKKGGRTALTFLAAFAAVSIVGAASAIAQDNTLSPPSVVLNDGANPGMVLPKEGKKEPQKNVGLEQLVQEYTAGRKTEEQIAKEIREEAFNAALTGLFPLRPQEIRTLLEQFDKTKEAVEKPIYPYPTPELVVQTVSLDPGTVPPVIKVAVGHVTTLAVVDVTGAPWPIQDMTWAGNFEVVKPEDEEGSIIRVTPMEEFAHGNISMRLIGLKTPVVFTIQTHRDAVHYRFDARIPEFGPGAQIPLVDGGISIVAGSSAINAVLDGVPPESFEKLNVVGVDGRTTAYLNNKETYVRTPLTLLSPGWSSSVSSADGMSVYKLKESPVLLLSDNGKVVRAHVSKKEIDDE